MTYKNAEVIETKDTGYKNGHVVCAGCKWYKEFGDGFNQHTIETCPNCDPTISTRVQEKLTTGSYGNFTVQEGRFYYFAMSNGINCQYKKPYVRSSRHAYSVPQ